MSNFDLVLFNTDGDYEYYSEALETEDEIEAEEYAEDNDYDIAEFYKKDDNGDFVIYEVYGEGVAKDDKANFLKVVGNMGTQFPTVAEILEEKKDSLPELIEALNNNEEWLGENEGNIIYGIYKEAK